MTAVPSTGATTAEQLGPVVQAVISQEILDAMGMNNLTESEKQDLYQTMIATVQDRVLARLLDELPSSKRIELVRLLNHATADEVSAYIAGEIPNLDAIMGEEALRYKGEMIENAAHVSKALGIHDALTQTSNA